MTVNKYNNDYSHIDWETELNDFFSDPNISIASFTEGKPYSYWAVRDRIRKDPRYPQRKLKKYQIVEPSNEISFLPVVVQNCSSQLIRINGFEIEVGNDTDPESLKTVLKAMRSL